MTTQQSVLDYSYADASSVEVVDSEILAIYASGFIPVEVFNRILAEKSETEAKETWDQVVERVLHDRADAWERLATL